MEQENKQVTQWLLTRTIELSWLRTSQLELKKTSSEKMKPDREIWSSWMLMREMEEEIRRQESAIVKHFDAYDDVKITYRQIPKESWRNILVVKEVTSWEGNQLENKIRAQQMFKCRKEQNKSS
ncbi:hypothetical protein F511_17757 [Dorcoceras hygrometricum]|uniref:Uncharacterized protein n=1 Tax=Dorcoceras hygrometricum TaxID=472368 RepID=A0A2Z7BND6_9LAMI|nr:hypothetical protein F511_17757 [Dorcoceras hygrometricum]